MSIEEILSLIVTRCGPRSTAIEARVFDPGQPLASFEVCPSAVWHAHANDPRTAVRATPRRSSAPPSAS